MIDIPLPNHPVEAISPDYFHVLSTTSDGNKHIMLIMDRFSRRASMCAVCAAKYIFLGTAGILVSDYIP